MEHKEMVEVLREQILPIIKRWEHQECQFALSLAIEKLEEAEKFKAEVVSNCKLLLKKLDKLRSSK